MAIKKERALHEKVSTGTDDTPNPAERINRIRLIVEELRTYGHVEWSRRAHGRSRECADIGVHEPHAIVSPLAKDRPSPLQAGFIHIQADNRSGRSDKLSQHKQGAQWTAPHVYSLLAGTDPNATEPVANMRISKSGMDRQSIDFGPIDAAGEIRLIPLDLRYTHGCLLAVRTELA
jgi:hypothetical protein